MKRYFIQLLSVLVLGLALNPTGFAEEGGPNFSHDLEEAKAMAKESGKPLITIFSASWCPPCQKMKKGVYPSSEVKPYHDKFVWAYLDADESQNRDAMALYGVSSIPHIHFLLSDGESLGHFKGGVPADTFTSILDQVLKDVEEQSGS